MLGPKIDLPHLVNSGDQEFARALCEKMRKARAKSSIPDRESINAVVPLPMTPELGGFEMWWLLTRAFLAGLFGWSSRRTTVQNYNETYVEGGGCDCDCGDDGYDRGSSYDRGGSDD